MTPGLQNATAVIAAVAFAFVPALPAGATSEAGLLPAAPGVPAFTAAQSSQSRAVTLVTGDTVQVDAEGRAVGLVPAKGRESIPVSTSVIGGDSYVLPSDVDALVTSGKLDQRLFDVTELSDPAYEQLEGSGVPLIVRYDSSTRRSEARSRLSDTDGTAVRADLSVVQGEALTVGSGASTAMWSSLTEPSAQGLTLAPGVTGIALDGVVRALDDVSAPQIGAPTAWAAGYDGTGVKVAVLDTGIDTTHPDLAPQVVASANFSTSDALDHVGHGTHVASILAGTGAMSNGKYKGIASGAKLLSGKVLDETGVGTESGIIAGMQWAVQQGADIVNMSIGSPDQPGVSPVEAAVNTLSNQALFVIAAGNSGPGDSTLTSPGSAEAALTVGAVNSSDALADFSSRGPRLGDSGLKPDLTAPGVGITAAAAPGSIFDVVIPGVPHPAPGYLTFSGTSMATAHVSGAAAILAEQHPTWTPAELKQALIGSTSAGPYTATQGGSGRVDVAHAITQKVLAQPASLSFGATSAVWPLTKTLTYRNRGSSAVTLTLSPVTTGPNGGPAPVGFFAFSATRVQVPAGGTASIVVVANTVLGTSLGDYSFVLTATGNGQTVRTAGAVKRVAAAG